MPRFVTGWPDAQTIPLAGLQPGTDLSAHPLRGPLFETYLLQNLASILGDHLPEAHILHYRSHAGHEVDFIIETPGAVLAIEAKAAATVDARDVRGLAAFVEKEPCCRAGLVAFLGTETRPLGPRQWAVPAGIVLS